MRLECKDCRNPYLNCPHCGTGFCSTHDQEHFETTEEGRVIACYACLVLALDDPKFCSECRELLYVRSKEFMEGAPNSRSTENRAALRASEVAPDQIDSQT